MRQARQYEIEEEITQRLVQHDISPWKVTYTTSLGADEILGITLFIRSDLLELLDILEYSTLCDKSGYTIFEDTNTIVFSKMALLNLYVKL